MVELIGRERVDEIISIVEQAKEQFRGPNLEGGMTLLLQEAHQRLNNYYLPESCEATLAGLDSDVKKLEQELLERGSKPS